MTQPELQWRWNKHCRSREEQKGIQDGNNVIQEWWIVYSREDPKAMTVVSSGLTVNKNRLLSGRASHLLSSPKPLC